MKQLQRRPGEDQGNDRPRLGEKHSAAMHHRERTETLGCSTDKKRDISRGLLGRDAGETTVRYRTNMNHHFRGCGRKGSEMQTYGSSCTGKRAKKGEKRGRPIRTCSNARIGRLAKAGHRGVKRGALHESALLRRKARDIHTCSASSRGFSTGKKANCNDKMSSGNEGGEFNARAPHRLLEKGAVKKTGGKPLSAPPRAKGAACLDG